MTKSNDKVLYYPVWISPGRKTGGWSWGRPCDSPREAVEARKVAMADCGATLGCVVRAGDGEMRPMISYLVPPSARKIAGHWDELWDCTDPEQDSGAAQSRSSKS